MKGWGIADHEPETDVIIRKVSPRRNSRRVGQYCTPSAAEPAMAIRSVVAPCIDRPHLSRMGELAARRRVAFAETELVRIGCRGECHDCNQVVISTA